MNRWVAAGRETAEAIVRGYGAIVFATNRPAGLLVMAATFCTPEVGLAGLGGAALAWLAGRVMGFDRAALRDGRLLFNAVLGALAFGFWMPPGTLSPAGYGLGLAIVSWTALGLTVMLNHAAYLTMGTSARSLPFCVVAAGLYAFLVEQGWSPGWRAADYAAQIAPSWGEVAAHALAAISFSALPAAGWLVALALLAGSRLNFVHGVIGFGVALAVIGATDRLPGESPWIILNAVLTTVAVGGIFFVPSWRALALAVFCGALSVVVGVTLLRVLRSVDLPVLTLPLNVVTIGAVAVMRWGRGPLVMQAACANPETAYRLTRLEAERVPEAALPTVALPFDGEWLVTQGFDGAITHRGAWRHGLDFEVGERPASGDLADFSSFGAPVISPVDGVVAAVADGVPDNAVGEVNFKENWGNTVVIDMGAGLYVQLSHLGQRKIRVREGERVRAGQLVGHLGNSGRSPFPHLHMQVQASPRLGAPTVAFRIAGYRTIEHGRAQYHFRGLPREGETVTGARGAKWMEECFIHREESVAMFEVTTREGQRRATIGRTFDEAGRPMLENAEGAVSFLMGGSVALPISSARQGIMGMLAMVGRIPLVPQEGMKWVEVIDPTVLSGSMEKLIGGVLAPYTGRRSPMVKGEITACDARTRRFTAAWLFPDGSRIQLTFESERGLVCGRREWAGGWLNFCQTNDEPAKTAAAEVRWIEPAGRR